MTVPLRLDFFHLLQEPQKITKRLERKAYRAIESAERARRAEIEAQAPSRRRGRPLTVKIPRSQAETQEQQAIETHDLFVWLMRFRPVCL